MNYYPDEYDLGAAHSFNNYLLYRLTDNEFKQLAIEFAAHRDKYGKPPQVSVKPEVKVNFAEVIELIDAMIIDMNGWEPIINDYDKGFDRGYKNALTTLKEDISKISA